MNEATRPVYIIWDIENVRPPTSITLPEIVRKLKEKAKTLGRMKEFLCFVANRVDPKKPTLFNNPSKPSLPFSTKRELMESGVTLEEVPDPKPEAADKFILTQLLKIALDEKDAPFGVILLSGDRDFARALSLLQMRGKFTCLIHNEQAAHTLLTVADETIPWRAFLGLEKEEPSFPPTALPPTTTKVPIEPSLPTAKKPPEILPAKKPPADDKALFDEIVASLRQDCIIPDAKNLKARWKNAVKDKGYKHNNFEAFLTSLLKAKPKAVHSVKFGNRCVYWPMTGAYKFADQLNPDINRFAPGERKLVIKFILDNWRQQKLPPVYLLAKQLKDKGPSALAKPLGYVIELVQIMLNLRILVFNPKENYIHVNPDPQALALGVSRLVGEITPGGNSDTPQGVTEVTPAPSQEPAEDMGEDVEFEEALRLSMLQFEEEKKKRKEEEEAEAREIEKARQEAERIAREKAEQERLEQERLENERLAKEKAEKERQERERLQREKEEQERLAEEARKKAEEDKKIAEAKKKAEEEERKAAHARAEEMRKAEEARRAREANQQWACGACTFLNAPELRQCEMCEMPRSREINLG